MTQPSHHWHPLKRIVFRFLFVWVMIALFPFPINTLEFASGISDKIWMPLMPWVGEHILRIGYEFSTASNGSGDKTSDYVQIFTFTLIAFAGCLIWSALDRKRTHHQRLALVLSITVRYYLGYIMLSYGFAKVFYLQFSEPGFTRLLQPYGSSSPMGLLWTFMGYSRTYCMFAGAMEVLGGALLFFRRTTTIGALVITVVMSNVALMNFCFDVPVKLYSSMLLLMALGLLYPEMGRLSGVLLFRTSVAAAPIQPLFSETTRNRAAMIFKAVLVTYFFGYCIYDGVQSIEKYGPKAPKPKYYGLYEVETFERDGELVPPLFTDKTRWRRVVIERKGFMTALHADDSRRWYVFNEEADSNQVQVAPTRDRENTRTWTVEETQDGLILSGELEESTYKMTLKRKTKDDFLLMNRGFHWINEFPYNR